jgi:hypothetical protein
VSERQLERRFLRAVGVSPHRYITGAIRGGRPIGERQSFRAGPTGLIVYQAAGDAPVSPKKLSVQFLSAVLAAEILSYLLSPASASH